MSIRPLLCELHAHTTWSDGSLSVRELVDLYGATGFDVLAVTDHIVGRDAPWLPAGAGPIHVHAANHDAYLAEVESEAERALARYGLLVLPGLELTYDHSDPLLAAHAVAVGLRSFIDVDGGIDPALHRARATGAALIAAHPYSLATAGGSPRATARFAAEPDWAHDVVDRFELVNRHETFEWVAARRLPVVANGDFHLPEHLQTWKTVLHCEQNEDAIVEALRSGRRVDLTRIDLRALAA
jgi:predicted metal-dependent phosphoesterase TrpH